jgi:hypothetical protein
MLRAPATGKPGDQFRRELHRVQVPPATLIGVIGQAAGPAAFGATHAGTDVGKADLDSSIPELEVDRLHAPGVIEAEQTGVVRRECFHPGNLRHQHPRFDRPVPRKSPKNPNLGGRRVIFDVGGPSKIGDILKYDGMADDLIPLVPVQWIR